MRTPPFSVRAFPGMRSPSDDFEAVRDDLQISFQYWEIDLSSARSISAGTQLTIPIKGNTLYIDQNTDVGNATAIFHDGAILTPPKPPRFFLQPGSNVALPFDQITFENTAQAGKILRIFYGVDIDFRPGNSNSVSITGTINTTLDASGYGASYKSNTNMLANTPEQIFSAASNTNGAKIWVADYTSSGAGQGINSFVAKATAPASPIDGVVIACGPAGPQQTMGAKLGRAITIPAGLGLYRIPSQADIVCIASCLYTLL